MSDVVVVERATARNRAQIPGVRYFIFGGVLVLGLSLLFGLALWFRPTLLAAYNVERAGRLMDIGLTWPEPRVFDSLPLSQNDAALQQALGHLAAALRWQPDSIHAYRLAAQIYAAQQAWPQAAEVLDRAQALDENNTLLAWDRALVYEQIWRQLRVAPGESLVPALEHAEVVAPSTPIETPFCRNGRTETCYSARTTFSQPLATSQRGPEIAADVIFLHPPAELHLAQMIPQAQSTLFFLMGLDPRARGWGSDGAGFQVLVQDGEGPVTPVYDVTLDALTVSRGWTPATVDLAPWAGKTITLILRTTAGSAHNTTADWYGWGNVSLLSAAQARLALLEPEAHTRAAWTTSGVDPSTFQARAEEALRRNQYMAAASWNMRSHMVNNQPDPEPTFVDTVVSVLAGPEMNAEAQSLLHSITSGHTRIKAETLRWMPTGELLFAPHSSSERALVWTGDAVGFLHVKKSAIYRITVRAQNTLAPPINFAITHNLETLEQFTLARGDMSWQNITVMTHLDVGDHIVGIRYLNDGNIDGIDRNLVIDWIDIEMTN